MAVISWRSSSCLSSDESDTANLRWVRGSRFPSHRRNCMGSIVWTGRRLVWVVILVKTAAMTLFGVPGKGLDLYHIGLAVPDVHTAMAQYSAAFGFTWARIRESTPEVIV